MKKTIGIHTDEINKQDAALGLMQRSITCSLHDLILCGCPTEVLIDIQEGIGALSATIWAILALKLSHPLNDKNTDRMLAEQEKQLERLYAQIKDMIFDLYEKRLKHRNDKAN
jgi:hypothetical protein